MKKLIKNYTTDIPIERTVAEIQNILAQNGARVLSDNYSCRCWRLDLPISNAGLVRERYRSLETTYLAGCTVAMK